MCVRYMGRGAGYILDAMPFTKFKKSQIFAFGKLHLYSDFFFVFVVFYLCTVSYGSLRKKFGPVFLSQVELDICAVFRQRVL